jgi:large subunit ribosomal protein L18
MMARHTRHQRLRKRVIGIDERPRLCVYRSHKHLIVQVINDRLQKTLLGGSTSHPALRKVAPRGGNVAAAEQLGTWVATEAKKLGIQQVVFDRGGYHYHGRVKALAEAARAGGLQF